jgi:hypothetical protein
VPSNVTLVARVRFAPRILTVAPSRFIIRADQEIPAPEHILDSL